jgi:hypothetical protein
LSPLSLSPTTAYWLDKIADAYTPLLLLLAVVEIFLSWRRGQATHFAYLVYAVILVYSLMFADKRWGFWASLGLDYSTHSAAAFCLVVVICWYRAASAWLFALTTLLAYGFLMYILNYHSWLDMFTTVLACALCLAPVGIGRLRQVRAAKPSNAILGAE